MKPIHNCVVALFAFSSTLTHAQQGAWEEDWFFFGDATHPEIVAVHLIHVFDGTQGRVIGITYESQALDNCGGGANGGTDASDRVLLWTPPPIGSPPGYPGTFEAAPLCRTFLFCGGHTGLADGRIFVAIERRGVRLFEPRRSFRR